VVVESLKKVAALPLDCHLMVSKPEDWIEPFAQAGASIITVHAEATPHLDRLLGRIRELGCKAGVSINPATSLTAIEEVLGIVDLVLVMSVNPGFGGQKFIERTLEKVANLREIREDRKFLIEVDGGVSAKNIRELHESGADVFVAGSSVFGQKDRAAAIASLKDAIAFKRGKA
jgi:ribulose-phosphate 3-epimerase